MSWLIAGIELFRPPRATRPPLLLFYTRLNKSLSRECVYWKAIITTQRYLGLGGGGEGKKSPRYCNKFNWWNIQKCSTSKKRATLGVGARFFEVEHFWIFHRWICCGVSGGWGGCNVIYKFCMLVMIKKMSLEGFTSTAEAKYAGKVKNTYNYIFLIKTRRYFGHNSTYIVQ